MHNSHHSYVPPFVISCLRHGLLLLLLGELDLHVDAQAIFGEVRARGRHAAGREGRAGDTCVVAHHHVALILPPFKSSHGSSEEAAKEFSVGQCKMNWISRTISTLEKKKTKTCNSCAFSLLGPFSLSRKSKQNAVRLKTDRF